MIFRYRGRSFRAYTAVRPILGTLAAMALATAPSPAPAASATIGNVSPVYPGGGLDPWSPGVELIVGNLANGSLTINGGSDVTSVGGTAGFDPGVLGTVVVTGAGSTWINSQDLLLGVFGTGTLDVLAGARVENQGASLGHIDGSGQVRVEGAGSQWLKAQDLVVGNGAQGQLTIQQQGLVRNRAAWIGLNVDAVGSVVVDGQQSTWELTDSLSLGDVADSGAATLSLTGAGSRVYVGAAAVVQGALLPMQETALIVSGSGGAAQLAIYDGNTVQNSGNGYVGVAAGESGSVIVDGAASAWNNNGDVFVGVNGTGTLSLADGGTVSSGDLVSVGAHGTVMGNGTLVGMVVNSGTMAPGQSVGSLAVTGNYSHSSTGKMQVELADTLAGEFDTLSVTGEAALDGTLEVSLGLDGGNPFVPQLGNTFQFLTGLQGVAGKFAAADLPTLGAGKMWQIRYSTTAATLAVTMAGDYNDNGAVDAADYTVWRDLLGATRDPRADGDTNGVVNVADYNIWKANFGLTAGAGALAGGDAGQSVAPGSSHDTLRSVPEPNAALILLIGGSLLALTRRLR